MSYLQRPLRRWAAVLLVAFILPFSAVPAAAADGATVPTGFVDQPIFTGLDHPMAIAFAPNGNIFVAEKRGKILIYSNLADTTPTVFADLHTNVHNYWDRGLMGLAIDPGFPARPYVYVLYAYNHILGDPSPAPRWPSADALDPPGSAYDDRCTNPPRGTTDGCVISGRLSRLTSAGGVMSGPEHVMIEDWCSQFPSHSVGSLMFGPEGALYVSGGEGANFNAADYGQFGGTLPNTPTPTNPCGDPGAPAGTVLAPPDAEGGAFRSQDLRTPGDPVTLDGAVLRIDPDTGLGWPANALSGDADANARRIIGYGLRNPFRFTIRPGTSEVWIGDVGYQSWEEVDRLVDPSAAPRNFGWPCYEGNNPLPSYVNLGLEICDELTAGLVTAPYYTYLHSQSVVGGDGCTTGGSSISGLTFLSDTSFYPDQYDGGLLMSDYTRGCIWFVPEGSNGLPNLAARSLFANLARADAGAVDGAAVFLTTAPNGDLVYADYDRGEIRTVRYTGGGLPPTARFTATPQTGPAPLSVTFDGSASTGAGSLVFDWDLDADGQYDDATGMVVSRSYSSVGNVTVRLRVTDPFDLSDTTNKVISVGNSPPTVSIDAPVSTLTWKVGDAIAFSASATDLQDGTLPASAFSWTLAMRHCPSNCHSHVVETFTGVKSGAFDAEDHDVPSHLLLSVEVTDSNGSTATDEVEIYPRTGTITTSSSPGGIVTSAGEVSGTSPTTTGIVGSAQTVSAPATAVIGEATYAFASWSDGGARSHSVPIVQGSTSLTASYTMTGAVDISDTCGGSAAAVGPTNKWQTGRFGSSDDVDWYRFKLTASTRVRLVLGALPVAGRLELYKGCSTRLAAADRSGTGSEQIIRTLPAGTYAIRLSGSGNASTPAHAFLIQKLGSGVRVLSSKAITDGGTLRIVGEVYNNTSTTRGPVTVTARLYSAGGSLLATRSAKVLTNDVASHARAPFSIVGSRPAGYHHVTFTVSAPTTSRRIVNPAATVTRSSADGAGRWIVSGTIRNQASSRIGSIRLAVTLYDRYRNVLDVARAGLGSSTLASGGSTTFGATVPSTGPDLVYLRGAGVR